LESFYFEKNLSEPYVDHLVKQREKEFLVAIMLFPLQYNPATQIPDTTESYKKAMDALTKIKNGEDFAETAKKYSEDPETAKRGGMIPNYITSGKVQRPIEEAIFSTPVGSFFPELIKTQYGYFIIKVINASERKMVKAGQILIAINDTRDSVSAYKKADSLLELLRSGKDFGKIAKENSDDKVTAAKNGELGEYYSRSTGLEGANYPLVAEFEKALYNLKDGEISGLVKSEFGFHIIKRETTKAPDFDKERSDLRKIYKRLYFEDDKKKLMDDLSKSLNFKINNEVFNQFISNLDSNSTTLKEGWDKNIPESLHSQTIYSINNESKDVSYLVGKLNKDVELRGIATNKDGINKALNILIEPVVFENATKNMEQEYPDFNQLMKEFKDGILLFKVEAQEVWDKMKFDSTMARKFFDTLSKKFYTDDMYDFTEIFILNDSVAKDIYKRVSNGEDFNKVAGTETQRDNYREKRGEWGC
jgi:peptidyl-prolyl cis-trans isomerase SurA